MTLPNTRGQSAEDNEPPFEVLSKLWDLRIPGGDIEAKRLTLKLLLIGLAINCETENWSREKFGLSRSELAVLMALRRAPAEKMRPTDLFVVLSMSSAGVTKLVKLLADRGLVVRDRNPAHRGGFLVGLTDTGRALADEAHRSIEVCGPIAQTITALKGESRRAIEGLFDLLLGAAQQGAAVRKSRSQRLE